MEIGKGETLSVAVDATDNDGIVTEVRLYIDEVGVTSMLSFPFNAEVYTGDLNLGEHTLKATAKDDQGAESSDVIHFSIGELQVTDYDGNIYQTVEIGTQIWMKGSLLVTHFSDGSPIPNMADEQELNSINPYDKSYWWYDNNPDYGEDYGALYTWAAAMNGAPSSNNIPSGVQGVCPDGWHLPSDAEWMELEKHLGMSQEQIDGMDQWRGTDQGGQLKETGTAHWNAPNNGATNSSGFTALPAGYRDFTLLTDGASESYFGNLGKEGTFWTSTGGDYEGGAFRRGLDNTGPSIYRNKEPEMYGYSVRCLKN